MIHEIEVYRNVIGLKHPEAAHFIKKAVYLALEAENVSKPSFISVTLTDDKGIQDINFQTRGIDKPTDVLSFPLNELVPGSVNYSEMEYDYSINKYLLGDMVISIPTCERQGEEFGHGFKREIMYLTVHSVLHLLGYDHLDEGPMKAQMREREKIIMGDA